MKQRAKWFFGAAVLAVALLQLIQPDRTNPPVTAGRDLLASNAPPAEIVTLLRAACYDCHSHETRWPWYSRISPISWWVVDHVKDGRKHLNFSDWPHDRPKRARTHWRSSYDEVEAGDMPLASYTWLHPESRLSTGQRQALLDWAEQEADRLKAVADEAGEE